MFDVSVPDNVMRHVYTYISNIEITTSTIIEVEFQQCNFLLRKLLKLLACYLNISKNVKLYNHILFCMAITARQH